MRVYYHPTVGDYAKYDSFEVDHAALAGVPSGTAAGIAGWAFKRASWEALLASIAGGGLMAGAFGAFYPKKILSWFNPPPFDAPTVYPRQIPKAVVSSFIGESGQVLNLLMHHGAGDVVKDYSPHKNDGKIRDASWVDGPWGWALGFDGARSYVQLPSSPSLQNFKQLTVLVWDKPPAYTGVAREPYDFGYWASPYGFLDQMSPDANKHIWFLKNTEGKAVGGGVSFTPNEWIFHGCVWDGSKFWVVKNGEMSLTATFSGTLACSAYAPRLGSRYNGVSWYNGLISIVQVYNRALSAEDIRRHYESTKPLFT